MLSCPDKWATTEHTTSMLLLPYDGLLLLPYDGLLLLPYDGLLLPAAYDHNCQQASVNTACHHLAHHRRLASPHTQHCRSTSPTLLALRQLLRCPSPHITVPPPRLRRRDGPVCTRAPEAHPKHCPWHANARRGIPFVRIGAGLLALLGGVSGRSSAFPRLLVGFSRQNLRCGRAALCPLRRRLRNVKAGERHACRIR